MTKRERIEELKYVLEMYKNTLTILEIWDIEDLRNRIKSAEGELFALQKKPETLEEAEAKTDKLLEECGIQKLNDGKAKDE